MVLPGAERKPMCAIESGNESLDEWVERPYITPKLREELSKANLLLVPSEGHGSYSGPVFPVGTEEVFQFLKDESPPGIVVDVCIEDDDYRELALYDDSIYLPAMILSAVVFPLVKDLIAAWVKKKLGSRRGQVFADVTTVDPDGRSTKLTFMGPAEEFSPALDALADRMKSDKEENLPAEHAPSLEE